MSHHLDNTLRPSWRPRLFQFGTGPIRGFATTLTLGLLANVFTAVVVAPRCSVASRATGTGWTTARPAGSRSTSWRTLGAPRSLALVAACFVLIPRRHPVGLDFTGGTTQCWRSSHRRSRRRATRDSWNETVRQCGPASGHALLIRLRWPAGARFIWTAHPASAPSDRARGAGLRRSTAGVGW